MLFCMDVKLRLSENTFLAFRMNIWTDQKLKNDLYVQFAACQVSELRMNPESRRIWLRNVSNSTVILGGMELLALLQPEVNMDDI